VSIDGGLDWFAFKRYSPIATAPVAMVAAVTAQPWNLKPDCFCILSTHHCRRFC
jgi:hypothetical protein